jgi:Asp/Glu/hydantoin racemase
VHSQTWKSVLDIKGRDRATQKRNAQAYAVATYGKKVSQDESDAICLGTAYIKSKKSAF